MANTSFKDLIKKLKQIKGSYDDMVIGSAKLAKKFNFEKELNDYLDKNKDVSSSDVCEFVSNCIDKKTGRDIK